VEISSEDIPGWLVSSKGALTVALDVTVTPELEQEGNARELVNRIQKIRKDNGYELTDRIAIKLAGIGSLSEAVKQFATYIKTEVLADELELVDQLNEGVPVEVNEQEVKVWVNKLNRS
jgi:isoleucyl-tRNA synthetase